MRIRFLGVRGSIPAPMTTKQLKDKFIRLLELAAETKTTSDFSCSDILSKIYNKVGLIGGNTTCVEISANNTRLIFDMGTGIRQLGDEILHDSFDKNKTYEFNIFISHTHWDHLQGFPFFGPAYRPNVILNFYSPQPNIKERLEYQHDFRFFPVSMEQMASKKNYFQLETEETVTINGIVIKNIELHHPGKNYAYRIEYDGKSFVYATDAEYNNQSKEKIDKYIEFYKDADILYFDAHYSFDEEIEKIDWGHSSAIFGIELAVRANVKSLYLTHHAPEKDDFEIYKLLEKALEYLHQTYPEAKLKVELAREDTDIVL